jgi:hypothetical protein
MPLRQAEVVQLRVLIESLSAHHLSRGRISSRRMCKSAHRCEPALDDCHSENPTENRTCQSDTTGRIRHDRTSFLSNPDESDLTGPFRPFAATS